jgi:hypothetical protein
MEGLSEQQLTHRASVFSLTSSARRQSPAEASGIDFEVDSAPARIERVEFVLKLGVVDSLIDEQPC